MSAEAPRLTRSWAVGERTVSLSIASPKPGSPFYATACWSPTEPARLSTEKWREYKTGRNEAFAQLATELGISVAVLDL